jgi:hypothetical protein
MKRPVVKELPHQYVLRNETALLKYEVALLQDSLRKEVALFKHTKGSFVVFENIVKKLVEIWEEEDGEFNVEDEPYDLIWDEIADYCRLSDENGDTIYRDLLDIPDKIWNEVVNFCIKHKTIDFIFSTI